MILRIFSLISVIAIALVFSRSIYSLEHTEVHIQTLQEPSGNCSPDIIVQVRTLGLERVISNCLVAYKPLEANCTSEKIFYPDETIKLDRVCVNRDARWTVALYAKHTFFRIPKIELVNETLK